MNYLKIYNDLIEKAKIENVKNNEYYEIHHIKPRSLNGSDDDKNLVKLTFRQHYVAHELLVKIHPDCKKLIHALWMMTITTLNSIAKTDINEIDCRIRQRIDFLKKDYKTMKYMTSYAYEKCRQIYRDMMNGHVVTNKTRELISIRTKEAMNSHDIIKRVRKACSKGSKGTKWYYDKQTLECFKQFPRDPDIDLEKYSYGRPRMSESQRKKISDVQLKTNKKIVHNDDLKLSYWIYLDYFDEFESSKWKDKKVDYGLNKKFIKIVNELKSILIDENFFDYEKFFFHPNCLTKRKKILNPGFFDMCEPVLKNWFNNQNFKDDLKKFIKEHKDEIDVYSKKYFKNEAEMREKHNGVEI